MTRIENSKLAYGQINSEHPGFCQDDEQNGQTIKQVDNLEQDEGAIYTGQMKLIFSRSTGQKTWVKDGKGK